MKIDRKSEKSVRGSAIAGTVILVIAALLSGVATGKMMWLGSLDDAWIIRAGKVILGLGLVEGGIAWTYHGIRKIFTNGWQRAIGWVFLFTMIGAVLCNLYTERMLARGLALNSYQQHWVDWAFDTIVVAVMLSIGAIQLFADDTRIERLRLRLAGEETEERLRETQEAREFPAALEPSESTEISEGKGFRR